MRVDWRSFRLDASDQKLLDIECIFAEPFPQDASLQDPSVQERIKTLGPLSGAKRRVARDTRATDEVHSRLHDERVEEDARPHFIRLFLRKHEGVACADGVPFHIHPEQLVCSRSYV